MHHCDWLRVCVGWAVLAVSAVLSSCVEGDGGSNDTACGELPESGLYATFDNLGEKFCASLTHPQGMLQARNVWAGTSVATIPNAPLICTPAAWNKPWSWHMDTEDLHFAEVTAEVCDGMPSEVEANCGSFGAGQYCPWDAVMVDLRDCDVGSDCPQVPR